MRFHHSSEHNAWLLETAEATPQGFDVRHNEVEAMGASALELAAAHGRLRSSSWLSVACKRGGTHGPNMFRQLFMFNERRLSQLLWTLCLDKRG